MNRRLNHVAFDVKDWQDLMRAVFFMGERGVRRMWGPGRHLAGNNLFSYYFDPEDNVVEYTTEVEQITSDDYVPPVRPMIPDQWGSLPPRVRVFDGVDWFWLPSLLRALAFLVRQRPDVVVLQWWSGTVLHSYLI